MSTDDKPLHVKVAEALGCVIRLHDGHSGIWWCGCSLPYHGDHQSIKRYDTDWSATGPLIEKYLIAFAPIVEEDTLDWRAASPSGIRARGETPLQAVCHLILALSEAGKLKAA